MERPESNDSKQATDDGDRKKCTVFLHRFSAAAAWFVEKQIGEGFQS